MQKITTFLMFSGKAEAAMNFYTAVFNDTTIVNIDRYGPNETGTEGTVKHATFVLHGQEFMCIDSNVEHGFTFTPAMSLFVKCETEKEIDTLYAKLSDGGQIYMPLGPYPFSKKFGWIGDAFGVTWQLTLV